MTPAFFQDYRVQTEDLDSAPAMTLPVMSRLFAVLHGALRRWPGQFALAFPQMRTGEHRHPGAAIRVFGESRDALRELLAAVNSHPVVRDYTVQTSTRPVPAGFDGNWVSYRRFRISGKSSRTQDVRMRRLAEAETLPYFVTRSGSTSQSLSLHIQPVTVGPCTSAEPDGYGLATASRPFSVPDLPVL